MGDNIKVDLKETGYEGVECIHLPQDRVQLLGSCEHYNELTGPIKGREFNQLSDYCILKKNSTPWSQLVSKLISTGIGQETYSHKDISLCFRFSDLTTIPSPLTNILAVINPMAP
jgi:hypothetical protein